MTKEELLELLQRDPAAAPRLAQQPGWDFRTMRELAQDGIGLPGVAMFLALSHNNVPSSILRQLCRECTDPDVVRVLAQNPNNQEELCRRDEAWVRMEVAGSRRLAPRTPATLKADPAITVRCRLAANPVIAPNIQTQLSQDPVPMVRLALLDNRKTEPEVVMALCDDKDTTVHLAALMAPNLPYDCMKIWAEEGEELGLLALCRRQDLPANIVDIISRSHFPSVQLALLRHQQLPEETLLKVATAGDPGVLELLAGRRHLPAAVQRAILEQSRHLPAVLRRLAANPALDADAALALTGAPDPAIHQALALNPGAGEDCGQTPRPDAEDTLLEAHLRLAAGGTEEIRKLLLANPCARCSKLLAAIAAAAGPQVREHLRLRGLPASA